VPRNATCRPHLVSTTSLSANPVRSDYTVSGSPSVRMSDVPRNATCHFALSASCLYECPLLKPVTLGLHSHWLAECRVSDVLRAEKRYVPRRAVRILSLRLVSPQPRIARITLSLAECLCDFTQYSLADRFDLVVKASSE
jgi:hypothetical protein